MTSSVSYTPQMFNLLSRLVTRVNPSVVVEIGVQTGISAFVIGTAMGTGELFLYDKFFLKYDNPPFSLTLADKILAKERTSCLSCEVHIIELDGRLVYKKHDFVDLLHIDICDTSSSIEETLSPWLEPCRKMILLPGPCKSRWHRKIGAEPFLSFLQSKRVLLNWDVTIVRPDNHFSLAVLTRRDGNLNVSDVLQLTSKTVGDKCFVL